VTLTNPRADHSGGWEVRNSRLAVVYWCTPPDDTSLPRRGTIGRRIRVRVPLSQQKTS